MLNSQLSIQDSRVAVARPARPFYPEDGEFREVLDAIRRSCSMLGWAENSRGAFGNIIEEGQRVVIKPNFVLHANQGLGGLLPLITHPSLVRAITHEALKANPSRVIVGDAPIQSCDFDQLMSSTGLAEWSAYLQMRDSRFAGVDDFRRTICVFENGVRIVQEEVQPLEKYVLYDLAGESLLEPISDDRHLFRVTCYDPQALRRTHSPGRHQYLIAREVIDADVVINLPKLKTHKKAGITNALKNLVGINGNKEFLPHHRLGGEAQGGDCYPGSDVFKSVLESVLDRQNSSSSRTGARAMSILSNQLQRLIRLRGDEIGVEGSWSGNETVARMTLDLNRIALYGKADSVLAERPQRRIIHISDAVIAGQGDGPLASEELPIGLILASENAAAMDWFGAHLLGYDAEKIPLLQLSFDSFPWPVAVFDEKDIEIIGDWNLNPGVESLNEFSKRQVVKHPAGWRQAAAANQSAAD